MYYKICQWNLKVAALKDHDQLLLLSTLYKAFYKQNSYRNVIFNGTAQSAIKTFQCDLHKLAALKSFKKGTTIVSFHWAPYIKPSTDKAAKKM